MLEHDGARHDWRALVVGTACELDAMGDFPGSATGRVQTCVWSADKKATTERVDSLRDAIRTLRADVVIPNYVAEAYAAAGLERGRGVRTIGVCHSRDYWYLELFQHAGDLLHGAWAVSDECDEMIRSALDPSTATLVAPYGMSLPAAVHPLPRSREPGARIRLIYAGRLESPQKRVMRLADLADGLTALGVPYTLTIVGDGPARDRLDAATKSHQNEGRVRLLGMLPPEHVVSLMQEHDALVLMSAYEGTPLAAIEAMANGRPVIATEGCGGAADAVRTHGAGLLAPVDHTHTCVENIARLHADQALLGEMSERARRAAEELFGMDAHAGLLERFIDRVMDGSDTDEAPSTHRLWSAILRATSLAVEDGPQNVDRAGMRRWRREFLASCQRSSQRQGVIHEAQWRIGCAVTIRARAPRVDRPGAALLAAAIDELEYEGRSRIAVFPAGRHSARNGHVLRKRRSVLCFVDDQADDASPRRLHGRPVLTPGTALERGADAVVISSDTHEDALDARAREWAGDRPVRTLYVPVRLLDGVAR